MSTEKRPMSKMAWQQNYSDNSGVEYAVEFDATEDKRGSDKELGVIRLHNVGYVEFPVTKIQWLIDCLEHIKSEQGL